VECKQSKEHDPACLIHHSDGARLRSRHQLGVLKVSGDGAVERGVVDARKPVVAASGGVRPLLRRRPRQAIIHIYGLYGALPGEQPELIGWRQAQSVAVGDWKPSHREIHKLIDDKTRGMNAK
jgi:hypothetical protein